MEKSIRIKLLGREYPLRVSEKDEDRTLALAGHVDDKLRSFRETHPDQSDTTAATITCLALADDLFSIKEELERRDAYYASELARLEERLGAALESVS